MQQPVQHQSPIHRQRRPPGAAAPPSPPRPSHQRTTYRTAQPQQSDEPSVQRLLRRHRRLQLQSTLVPTRRQRVVSAAVVALPSHWCTRTATAAAPDGATETGGGHATVRLPAPPAGKPRARSLPVKATALLTHAPMRRAVTRAATALRCAALQCAGRHCACTALALHRAAHWQLSPLSTPTARVRTLRCGAGWSCGRDVDRRVLRDDDAAFLGPAS